jgi:hypothetical protein
VSSAAAVRQRRWYSRQKAGEIVLPIVVDETRLAAVFQHAQLVSANPSREELASVLSAWVEQELTRYEREAWGDIN